MMPPTVPYYSVIISHHLKSNPDSADFDSDVTHINSGGLTRAYQAIRFVANGGDPIKKPNRKLTKQGPLPAAEDGEDATSPTPGKTFHVFLSYYSSNSYSHTLSDDELADSDTDNVQSSHGTLPILAQFFTFQSNMFISF
jgi:hypothetical protein